MSDGIAFVKGHGTENDFLLLPDVDGTLEITAGQVRALCDRHAGIGADGVIRIAPGEAGRWFMDYRNADGSIAEMCGNGARLFARYLVDSGLSGPGTIEFDTRGGVRTAELDRAGDVRIGMGRVRLGARSSARIGTVAHPGRQVDVGNPHLVCVVPSGLAGLDLSTAPGIDPVLYPDGANVEFITVDGPDALTMRVHERGVGETRSCGTGTVAAAAARLELAGRDSGTVRVTVPGGQVLVQIADGAAHLTGPAVLVGSGEIDCTFFDAAR